MYILSLYYCLFIRLQIDLQGFSQILQNFIHILGDAVQGPGPVHGPWARERLTLGTPEIRESSPKCPMMPLQKVKVPELDLPKKHYSAMRSPEASRRTILHLGEV